MFTPHDPTPAVPDVPLLTQATYLHRLGLVDATALTREAVTMHGPDEDPGQLHLATRCAEDHAGPARPVRSVATLEEASWGLYGSRRWVCGTCARLLKSGQGPVDAPTVLGRYIHLARHVSWSARADRVLSHTYPTKSRAADVHTGAARMLLADTLPPLPAEETVLADRIADQRTQLSRHRPSWRLRTAQRWRERRRTPAGQVWVTMPVAVFPASVLEDGWTFSYAQPLLVAGAASDGPHLVQVAGVPRWLLRTDAEIVEDLPGRYRDIDTVSHRAGVPARVVADALTLATAADPSATPVPETVDRLVDALTAAES